MTRNEIQALIDAKIAGQGTNVDAGGALPAILEALVDAVTPVVIQILGTPNNVTAQEVIDKLKINGKPATWDLLQSFPETSLVYIQPYEYKEWLRVTSFSRDSNSLTFVAGGQDETNQFGALAVINISLLTNNGGIYFAEY